MKSWLAQGSSGRRVTLLPGTTFFHINGALASTTATATITPQIKNLIGRVRKNKRAARAARTYEQVRAVLCKTTT